MLTEETMEKLKSLRLDALAAAWTEQQHNPDSASLSFDERLGLLVDAECLHRENRRLARLLKEAKLRLSGACIENLDYGPKRELDKAVVRQLATCRWVQEHHAVVITGATGTGKTQPTQHPVSIRELRRDGHGHRPNTPAARPDVPSCGDGPPAKDGSMLYGREAAECVWPHTYRIDKFCEIAETGAYFSTC